MSLFSCYSQNTFENQYRLQVLPFTFLLRSGQKFKNFIHLLLKNIALKQFHFMEPLSLADLITLF